MARPPLLLLAVILACAATATTADARMRCTAWLPCRAVVGLGSQNSSGRIAQQFGASQGSSVSPSRREILLNTLLGGGLITGSFSLGKRLRGGSNSPRMTIIDSAVHIWKNDPKYPWAQEAAANPPAKDASAEELLVLMEANSVDKTVIVQPICYRYDNSYVQDTIARYPSKFAGVARVDPTDPASVEKLELLKAAGFRGVRFGPIDPDWWDTSLMLQLLQKARQLRVPVLLFLGKDGGKKIGWIKPMLERVPDLVVIIDHMADVSPKDAEQIEALVGLSALPGVHVKVSHTWALSEQSYPWADAQQLVRTVLSAFGAERCMFASDWPVCMMPAWPGGGASYQQTVALAKEEYSKLVTAEELGMLLGGTAEKIWFASEGRE